MIYNPIFEEEQESEFKLLKRDIQRRAYKDSIKQIFNRVYTLLNFKSLSNILKNSTREEIIEV